MWRLIALALLAGSAHAYDLVVASSADRTTYCCVAAESVPPQILPTDGTYFTVEGDVYIFVTPEAGIDSVEFYIRTSDGEYGTYPEQIENLPPWDYKGGTEVAATPWQTYFTPNGLYVVRADITFTDGTTQVIEGGLGIANDAAPEALDPDPNIYDGTVTLSWVAPTHNEDGSEIPPPPDPAALAGFKLYWGVVPGNYQWIQDVPDPTATSYVIEGLAPGTYTFVGTAYNEAGIESRYSESVTKQVIGSEQTVPEPPTGLTAAENIVVYALSLSTNRVVLYPIGLTTQDVACDATQTVNGYYLVPVESVRFAEGAYSRTVFARCLGN